MEKVTFDLVTPIAILFNKIFHAPLEKVEFYKSEGFSGYDVEKIIRQYGIRVFGRIMDNPEILGFWVKRKQKAWCMYIITNMGLNVLNAPRNGVKMNPGGLPKAWNKAEGKAYGIIDNVVDIMGKLMG